VRPDVVVMAAPCFYRFARILETGKPVQIQAAVPEFTVKASNKCILRGFDRLYEMQLHTRLLRPEEHDLAGEFLQNRRIGVRLLFI
jgi:hypothetical protein